MGRLGFEPRTNRLKAEYSTVELATPIALLGAMRRCWGLQAQPGRLGVAVKFRTRVINLAGFLKLVN